MAENITLALDAMSGDLGAKVVVEAASKVLKKDKALSVILVGNQNQLGALLLSLPSSLRDRVALAHADSVVSMSDKPAVVLRRKQDSSMSVALKLVRDRAAHGCVSAGNTGALMVLSRSIVRMLPGIERPAICKYIDASHHPFLFLDLGANLVCSGEQLYQYGVMGGLMAKLAMDVCEPRIALLNVGSEDIKGPEQVKLAATMLSDNKDLSYVGYVEGHELFFGKADVVVCDGFVGNIALKTAEGVLQLVRYKVDDFLHQHRFLKFLAYVLKPWVQPMLSRLNPESLNGASLLGLNGVVVKSHGAAGVFAFRKAIEQAALEVRAGVPQKINEHLDQWLI
ncbi:fatty acid/phospholipid synthesis protein [Oleiphilus messinensis]|uniref:Phosphate acyltransferase n=1 Tax=Oleiphilus messinensis TaxID=141451 RepID=A0A1Y0I7W1_9GAMM|nr:phosphate acyltransferase PlsX [Oleiphilus messinensis]ARU56289.1 fatty acid/phospholipid synthesis protein [Oleiphilus messinensis]